MNAGTKRRFVNSQVIVLVRIPKRTNNDNGEEVRTSKKKLFSNYIIIVLVVG